MAKRRKSKGRSMRNGNAPSPYAKYGKAPYEYSPAYKEWKRIHMAGKGSTSEWRARDRNAVRALKEAAE